MRCEGAVTAVGSSRGVCGPLGAAPPISMPSGYEQAAARPCRAGLTAAAAARPGSQPCCPTPAVQSEVAWLIKAVNPDVPLGEAALGLILEEVRGSWAAPCGPGPPARQRRRERTGLVTAALHACWLEKHPLSMTRLHVSMTGSFKMQCPCAPFQHRSPRRCGRRSRRTSSSRA